MTALRALLMISAGLGFLATPGLTQDGSPSILSLQDVGVERELTFEDLVLEAEAAETPDRALSLWRQALDLLDRDGVDVPAETDRVVEAIISTALRVLELRVADGDTRSVDETLSYLTIVVERLSNDIAKAWAWHDIGTLRAEHGATSEALSQLQRAHDLAISADDPRLRSLALRGVVDSALDMGEIAAGLADMALLAMHTSDGRAAAAQARAAFLAERGASDGAQAAGLQAAANGEADGVAVAVEALAGAGEFRGAILLALAIENVDRHGETVEPVVSQALASNSVAFARLAALSIADTGSGIAAWAQIAAALSDQGYTKQADDALGRIAVLGLSAVAADDTARAAEALADAGRIEQAETLLREATVNGASAERLERVVTAMGRHAASEGSFDVAEAALADITSPDLKAKLLADLGTAEARAGRIEAAQARVDQLEGATDRQDRVRRHMVKWLADDGQAEAARGVIDSMTVVPRKIDALAQLARTLEGDMSLIQEASALLDQIEDPSDRDAGIRHIALALVDLEAFDAAKEWTANISDPDRRSELLSEIGVEQAEHDRDAALSLADEVRSPHLADAVRIAVAQEDQRRGDLWSALGLLRDGADVPQRVLALRDVAEAQAHDLDSYALFNDQAETQQPEPFAMEGLEAEEGRAGTYRVQDLSGNLPGETLPPLPSFSTTVADIRADVPAIAPGRAQVSLMLYSQYNFKFVIDVENWQEFGRRQGRENPEFIFIESGVFDLPSLEALLDGLGRGDDAITRDGRTYTLRLPVLIGPDAKLVVSGTDVDELRLSRERGVYIINAGEMHVVDAALRGWEEDTQERAYEEYENRYDFRPFIISWSEAKLFAGQAVFDALGYQNDKSYGVSYSSGPSPITKASDIEPDRPTGAIVDSSFLNMYYAFYSYEADDVELIGNELRDNVVYGLDPHDRSQRLKIAYNTAYETHKKHGIIISREVDYTWIAGNIAFDNEGSGFMVDRDSIGIHFYANTALHNRQDGVTFFESSCALIASNLVTDNDREGLKIRNSWHVGLFDNEISGNQGKAIEIYADDLTGAESHGHRDFELDPYEPFATMTAVGNRVRSNGAGVGFSRVNSAIFGENQWIDQSPVLFAGSLAEVGPQLLSAGRNTDAVLVANECQQPFPDYSCPFLEQGYLAGDGIGLVPQTPEPGACQSASIAPVDGGLQ